MQPVCGDLHNFGRKVVPYHDGGNDFFLKPRSVFWEQTFLDSESEFRRQLKNRFGHDTLSCLGHISYRELPDFSLASAVEGKAIESINELPQNFSDLLVVCAVFGITDLHFDNLKVTKDNTIQIVDLEIVFYKSLSFADSYLINPKVSRGTDSIFQTLVGQILNLSDQELVEFFIRIFKYFEHFILHGEYYLDTLNQLNIFSQHTRVLLRHTAEYRSNQAQDDFSLEERTQIVRGDIPYFIKPIGQDELFFYGEPGKLHRAKDSESKFFPKIVKYGINPSTSLSPSRIKTLRANSILQLGHRIRKLIGRNISSPNFCLSFAENLIEVKIFNEIYRSEVSS